MTRRNVAKTHADSVTAQNKTRRLLLGRDFVSMVSLFMFPYPHPRSAERLVFFRAIQVWLTIRTCLA